MTDFDCDPGRVCSGGVCGPPLEFPDGGSNHAGADAAMVLDERGDGDGVAVAEAGMSDPCVPTMDDGARAKAADVPGALLGAWRLCNGAAADPSVLWLAGAAGAVQIDETAWQRGLPTDGQADAGASPSGLYYQIVEGTNGLYHFIDPDTASGAGADFSATVFTTSGALELTARDGPDSCAGAASRFARVGAAPLPGE